jgi:hypothetical protein
METEREEGDTVL